MPQSSHSLKEQLRLKTSMVNKHKSSIKKLEETSSKLKEELKEKNISLEALNRRLNRQDVEIEKRLQHIESLKKVSFISINTFIF